MPHRPCIHRLSVASETQPRRSQRFDFHSSEDETVEPETVGRWSLADAEGRVAGRLTSLPAIYGKSVYDLRATAISPSMTPRAQSIHPLRAGMADWGRSGTVYVEVLLAGLVSVVELDTVAVSPKVEGEETFGGFIVSVIGFAAPTFNVGSVQVTVPATLLQVQPVPEALPKVAPTGSTSTTETLAAGEGPLLVTVIV